MALKDMFSKGITAVSLKTSNMIEINKLKTGITTKEKLIADQKIKIGEAVVDNMEDFSIGMIEENIRIIEDARASIEVYKAEIEKLEREEREILGQGVNAAEPAGSVVFCPQCGAKNSDVNRFCEKCGTKLSE